MTDDFLRLYFWPLIITLALIAALINLGLAIARRRYPMVALVRGVAGFLSLALGIGIIVGKSLQLHPPFALDAPTVFIAAGVFVFATLWLPSRLELNIERESGAKTPTTMQERAARPTNATIRLQQSGAKSGGKTGADEWVN